MNSIVWFFVFSVYSDCTELVEMRFNTKVECKTVLTEMKQSFGRDAGREYSDCMSRTYLPHELPRGGE